MNACYKELKVAPPLCRENSQPLRLVQTLSMSFNPLRSRTVTSSWGFFCSSNWSNGYAWKGSQIFFFFFLENLMESYGLSPQKNVHEHPQKMLRKSQHSSSYLRKQGVIGKCCPVELNRRMGAPGRLPCPPWACLTHSQAPAQADFYVTFHSFIYTSQNSPPPHTFWEESDFQRHSWDSTSPRLPLAIFCVPLSKYRQICEAKPCFCEAWLPIFIHLPDHSILWSVFLLLFWWGF